MKEVLLSIQPKWCEKIASGEKKIEVRKTRPKEQEPFKCYIYCTKGDKKEQALLVDKNGRLSFGDYRNADNNDFYIANGKVIGEFICYNAEKFVVGSLRCDDIEELACLSYKEIIDYFYKENELNGCTIKFGYAWHISNLVIYDKPKKLSEFYNLCTKKEEFDCGNCEHFEQYVCANYLTIPPQSWQYVLEK